MRIFSCLNFILILSSCIGVGVYLYNVDFSSLVDPIYYIDAAFKSNSISEALYYGDGWFTDVGFIFLSYIYRLMTHDYHILAWLFSFGLSFLIFIALIRYVESGYLIILILMCVLSFSTVGIVFNVWRQGYAEALILLSVVFPSKRIHFSVLAALFHFNTAFVFLIASFIFNLSKANLRTLFPFLIFCLAVLLYVFVKYQYFFDGSINIYSKTEASSPWLRYIYSVFILFTSTVIAFFFASNFKSFFYESYLLKILLTLLCVSFVYVLVVPAAAERYLHYFFLLFPFFMANIFSVSDLPGRSLISILSIFHCSLTYYFLLQSDTWHLVKFISFI